MLIRCKECGKELSDEVKICPNCGFHVGTYLKKLRKEESLKTQEGQKKRKRKITLIVIAIVVVVIAVTLIGIDAAIKHEAYVKEQLIDALYAQFQ